MEYEKEGDVITDVNKLYVHRDTGTFNPCHNVPVNHQAWTAESFFDHLNDIVDVGGNGIITEPFEHFGVVWSGKQLRLRNKEFASMEAAARHLKKPASTVRRLVSKGRFDVLDKWYDAVKT